MVRTGGSKKVAPKHLGCRWGARVDNDLKSSREIRLDKSRADDVCRVRKKLRIRKSPGRDHFILNDPSAFLTSVRLIGRLRATEPMISITLIRGV